MEKNKSSWGVVFKYAIITALASFIFSLLVYLMNLYTSNWINYLAYVILFAGLIFAVKEHRDKNLGGFITFGQAFGTGFLFCIITGLIGVVTGYILMHYIAPDMVDEIMKVTEQRMVEKGMSEDQVSVAMEWTRKFMTPTWFAIWSVIMTAIFGAILSLIVAAIFKRVNPNAPPQA
ncbi:MAG: DUF4199 domain-containing protein [Chitinophagales bacterium]|nr:DUF4199 domain-containing protein [Bacteroidota bacterium]MBX7139700.1 DUF4199 domain-containing protein [Chitinophagales bacterium]